jgi:hypothetical protein
LAGADGAAGAATLEVTRAAGAEACIDAPHLTKTVEARLKRAVFAGSGSAPLSLSVELSQRDGAWVAKVRIADHLGPLGQRELSSEARHCSALDDSLALVVALLVDTPPARDPATIPSPEPVASAQPAPKAAPTAAAPTPLVLPPDTASPREPVRFGARATGALAFGLLPGVGPGIDLAAAARFPSGLRVRVLGELFFEQSASLDNGENGGTFSALRGGSELCGFSFGPRQLSFELCGGQMLGRLAASGVGFDRNADAAQLIVSLAAGADARLPLTEDLGLVLAARAEVPLSRDRFTGRQADGTTAVIFQPAPLLGVLKFGLEVGP